MELLGDPETLAEVQFDLAQKLCGECRDYHAIWPYRRLSRTVAGIESTADIVNALLREIVPRNGRVLIAGCADAGLLALTARATEGLKPVIDVADRCPTPLAVCARYAEANGLSIATRTVELTSAALPPSYDVVFADCVLQFVPRQSHVDVLRRFREAMVERSTLLLAERVRTVAGKGPRPTERAPEVIDGLAARRIKLPQDEASFRTMLSAMLDSQRTRYADCVAAGDLASRVAEAGFRIRPLSEDQRRRTVVVAGGDSITMSIVVASP